jgi:hypothetical protein
MVAVVVVVATSVAVAVETAGNCINYRIEKGLWSLFLLPMMHQFAFYWQHSTAKSFLLFISLQKGKS